MVLKLEHSRK